MIQIVSGDRAGADNLAEIVDPICNTMMAAGPHTQVDRHSIAPKNRMRIYVRRACIAHDIAGIVDGGCRSREKSSRYRQLPNPGCAAGVTGVIFPNDRKDIALTCNKTCIVNRLGFAYHLAAQRAEVGHLTVAPKKPMNKRAD